MSEELSVLNFGNELNLIRESKTLDEIRTQLKKIDLCKEALMIADTFREQAVKFAILEAEALVRLVELGGAKELNGNSNRRKAAEWLATLTQEERSAYIKMCEEGLLIEQVWLREIGKPGEHRRAEENIEQIKQEIKDKCQKNGYIVLDNYMSEINRNTKGFKTDVTDGIRKTLRSIGAVGINDGKGSYYMPDDERNKEIIRTALKERYRQIKADMINFLQIAKKAKVNIDVRELTNNNIRNAYLDPNGSFFILMALAEMGAIDKYSCYKFLAEAPTSDPFIINMRDAFITREYMRMKYRQEKKRGTEQVSRPGM